MVPLDITGQRFGRLVALRRIVGGKTKWLFRCDCGAEKEVRIDHVRSGRQVSCGCHRREATKERSLKHGHKVNRRASPELRAWDHAKGRCYNRNDPKYPNYGGRGIQMCAAWRGDAATFLRDMGPRPEGTTLDRIDVNGDYEPSNCRWATYAEQARNRTDNVYVEHGGKRIILKDYAVATGQDYKRLSAERHR
jgi:hypothetical protein